MRTLRRKESLGSQNNLTLERKLVAMEISNRAAMIKPQRDEHTLDSESSFGDDDLEKNLMPVVDDYNSDKSETGNERAAPIVTRLGLLALLLLTLHNCFSMLLIRFVMKDQPNFLASAAVLGSEAIKLACSCSYILFVQKKSIGSIVTFLKEDRRNTLLLVVPACAYNFQMTMAYVALANIDAALYSVICQSRLLFTAICAVLFLGKRLKYIQALSLVLLTCGVMLCNMGDQRNPSEDSGTGLTTSATLGISAALGISFSSGVASVYTEKVIKGHRSKVISEQEFGLAYTQVQLGLMSILTMGTFAFMQDWEVIQTNGLFHNFTPGAAWSVVNNAVGGLIVASVLKYADSVLKGYATALAATLTGILSYVMFGTALTSLYFMGIINVLIAVLLYNGNDGLNQMMC